MDAGEVNKTLVDAVVKMAENSTSGIQQIASDLATNTALGVQTADAISEANRKLDGFAPRLNHVEHMTNDHEIILKGDGKKYDGVVSDVASVLKRLDRRDTQIATLYALAGSGVIGVLYNWGNAKGWF